MARELSENCPSVHAAHTLTVNNHNHQFSLRECNVFMYTASH